MRELIYEVLQVFWNRGSTILFCDFPGMLSSRNVHKFLENRIRNRMRRAAGLHKTINVYCLSALSDYNARLKIEYE